MDEELFEHIWQLQEKFRSRYAGLSRGKQAAIDYVAYVQDELYEVRSELEPRFWKDSQMDFEKYKEEVADVFIMLVGLCFVSDLGYHELKQAIKAKLKHNQTRTDRK